MSPAISGAVSQRIAQPDTDAYPSAANTRAKPDPNTDAGTDADPDAMR